MRFRLRFDFAFARLANHLTQIHETIERLVNMLKRPEAEGAYIEDEEELVKAVEGIELGESSFLCAYMVEVGAEDAWAYVVGMDAVSR